MGTMAYASLIYLMKLNLMPVLLFIIIDYNYLIVFAFEYKCFYIWK